MTENFALDLALDFEFGSKPLLFAGQAMEYYGLRKAGDDIDLIVTAEDYERLAQTYPANVLEMEGDLGVTVSKFQMWKSIHLFDYLSLSAGAIEQPDYLIVSLEKLLFLKALGMKNEKYRQKYRRDLELIVDEVLQRQYERFQGQA